MRIKFPRSISYVGLILAFEILCRAQSTQPAGDLEVGKRAYEQGDYSAALKQLTPLAEGGVAGAQVVLGTMSLKGQGTTKDAQQALKWYQAAADRENADGQFYVGSIYLMGAGIAHDTPEGMKWLGRSADNGSPDAQVLLGLVYLQGQDGVERDLIQADIWFQLAAAGGDPLAPREIVAVEKQMTAGQIAAVKGALAGRKPPTGEAGNKKE